MPPIPSIGSHHQIFRLRAVSLFRKEPDPDGAHGNHGEPGTFFQLGSQIGKDPEWRCPNKDEGERSYNDAVLNFTAGTGPITADSTSIHIYVRASMLVRAENICVEPEGNINGLAHLDIYAQNGIVAQRLEGDPQRDSLRCSFRMHEGHWFQIVTPTGRPTPRTIAAVQFLRTEPVAQTDRVPGHFAAVLAVSYHRHEDWLGRTELGQLYIDACEQLKSTI